MSREHLRIRQGTSNEILFLEQCGAFGSFVNDDFVEKGRIVELLHGDMITCCKNPGEFRPRPVFVFQRSDAKNNLLPALQNY